MAWICVDKDGTEGIYEFQPERYDVFWASNDSKGYASCGVPLPKGTILKLIGRELTWEDESVELTED